MTLTATREETQFNKAQTNEAQRVPRAQAINEDNSQVKNVRGQNPQSVRFDELDQRVDGSVLNKLFDEPRKDKNSIGGNGTSNQNVAEMTVADLVRAAQVGDRAASGELFERYQSMVLSVAYRRLGDYVDAQELVQEVFVQALQKLGQLRTPECFGSWLRSITVRMAINRMVRGDRAVSTEPVTLEATVSINETPEDRAISVERAQVVREGIARLREMDRDTLIAFYVRGQSLIEMSEAFNAPIGTIKRRLHVARQRLAKEIEHLIGA